MSNIVDLARGKPATQSSKSQTEILPLETLAARAVNGESGGPFFETAAEWFPWWQVDLEEPCAIVRIELYNTLNWPSRSKIFTIMISEDSLNWTEVFSKTDHHIFGHDSETAFSIAFSPSLNARYVRVRLDNWDHFHLDQVRIYGHPEVLFVPSPTREKKCSKTTIFAVNFNEEDSFIPVYVDNFLNFTSNDCHLVVNFPWDRKIPTDLVPPSPRVHLFNGATPRKKWGATLLIGHMESFGHALQVLGQFDYFCTCASNGLFVRAFNADEAIAHLDRGEEAPVGMTREYMLDIHLDKIPRGKAWIWDNLDDSLALRRYLVDHADLSLVSLAQIEGLFAEKSEWATLYDRMEILEQCNNCLPSPVITTPALEEFLPISFFRRFGEGRHTNICHMLWDPHREVTLSDLVQFVSRLPAHMCQAKWFNRDKDAVATAAITVPWSLALLETLKYDTTSSTSHERIVTRALTTAFNKVLKQQELYTPLTRAWREDASWGRVQWLASIDVIPGGSTGPHDPLFFSGQPLTKGHRAAAWLDHTHALRDPMSYSVVLSEDADRCTVTLDSSLAHEAGGRHEWGDVWSVLFISPLVADAAQVFRISLKHPFTYDQEQLLHNVRRHTGDTEYAWPSMFHEDVDGYRHYYFIRPENHVGEIWIGLPNFHRTAIIYDVSFGITPV